MLDATPLLRLYSRFRNHQLARLKGSDTQLSQLLTLVRQASATRFGKDHNFSGIRTVADYQRYVPLRTYDQFWNDYFKESFPNFENLSWPGKIPYFALSSGTSSGTTKYLPLSQAWLVSNKKAGLDLLVHHVSNRPQSSIFAGKSFMLGGSTDLVEYAPGIWGGDLSGIAVKTLPWWARMRYFPPQELALLKDWEKKIEMLARESLHNNIRMISGVPSWLIIFFAKLAELVPHSNGKIASMYPELEMVVHGGVNFSPYFDQFKTMLEGSKAELREVYPASEAFIAVADRGFGDGLRVVLDHGVFYEFVPLEELTSSQPTRHWIGTIERNVNYAIVLSTCAGLWSYVLGDTVKFVDTDPPRLLITGRTSYYLSAFGEHVIAEELEDAVAYAAKRIDRDVADFSVGPLFPDQQNRLGGHLYIIEFAGLTPNPAELAQFSTAIDSRLAERNEDYAAHRSNGFGLRAPQIISVSKGTFASWMKNRGKLGGQHKVPRIITDRPLFQNLHDFVVSAGISQSNL